jgi:hypothetical protein
MRQSQVACPHDEMQLKLRDVNKWMFIPDHQYLQVL